MEMWNEICFDVINRVIDGVVRKEVDISLYEGWGVELKNGGDFAIEVAVRALSELEEYDLLDRLEESVDIFFPI